MKLTRPQTFHLKDPNHKRWIEDLFKLHLRNISFGTEVNGDDQNIDGTMIEIVNTGILNTEFAVTHNLGRVPLYWDTKYINSNAVIYASSTPWSETQAFFKCSINNAHIRLFIH